MVAADLVADDAAVLEGDDAARSAVTTSALCVAMSTVVPISLMRSSSWMISQEMSGSRLPVGSSAMMSRGSWTMARAMAVRCMLAAGELVGSLVAPGR